MKAGSGRRLSGRNISRSLGNDYSIARWGSWHPGSLINSRSSVRVRPALFSDLLDGRGFPFLPVFTKMNLLKLIAVAVFCLAPGACNLAGESDRLAADTHAQTATIRAAASEITDHVAVSDQATQAEAAKIPIIGTEIDEAFADLSDLERRIVAAPTTQQFFDFHSFAQQKISQLQAKLGKFAAEISELSAALAVAHAENVAAKTSVTKVAAPLAKIDKNADAQAKLTRAAVAEVAAIKSSLRYRIGGWIVTILWIAGILFVVHFIAAVVALCAPPPYNTYASIIAKAVNPLGWISSLLSHVELAKASAALTAANVEVTKATNAVAEVVNDIVPAATSYVQPYAPYSAPTTAVIASAVGVSSAAPIPVPEPASAIVQSLATPLTVPSPSLLGGTGG